MKLLVQTVLVLLFIAGCSAYANVPPNDIGMMLTPSGYDGKVRTPGQIDLGVTGPGGWMNRLVLIQRSGVEVKEQFLSKGEDGEDHRCLVGGKQMPVTLDVRVLLAIPNYETADGIKDLNRLFHLGNPQILADTDGRIMRISAESIYNEQARQFVRGRIRQICAGYESFDAMFTALADTSDKGLAKRVEHAVSEILKQQNVPLALVSAFPSNLKPDDTIIAAIAAREAAERRIQAIETITRFLDNDPTGSRRLVYQMQTWQEIVAKGNANGHNTILMQAGAPQAEGTTVVAIPTPKETRPPAAPKPEGPALAPLAPASK